MSTSLSSSRLRYTRIVPAFALLLALVLGGCGTGAQPEPTTPPAPTNDTGAPAATAPTAPTAPTATTAGGTAGTGGIDTAQSLVDALAKAGITVSSTGPIQQPFFSVKGESYTAGTGYLQIFEYADQAAADADAAKVKPDGTIEGYSVDWVASPHFYKMGRLIVIYLGDDTADLAAVQGVLGDPFATAKVRRLP